MQAVGQPHTSDVIVVGGGLSGLVAAYRLSLRGLRVELVEAAPQPGGVIATHRRRLQAHDGTRPLEGELLIEAGPNSATRSEAVDALLADLGITAERVDAERSAARRYLLRGDRLLAAPSSLTSFIATPLLSARAKLRLLREPFVIAARAAHDEESVAQFVRRRLGGEALDYAVEPLVGGIYAGDAERLSLAATFPALARLEAEHGSLARGAVFSAMRTALSRNGAAPSRLRATSFNFRGGMQTLTDALAGHLPQRLLGAHAVRLARDAGGWSVTLQHADGHTTRHARALLLALPAHTAADLLAPLGEAAGVASTALQGIAYPPMATVSVAYRRRDVSHPLDGFGFLAPRVERAAVLGTLFVSSMFAGRTPEGVVLLTSFVGGTRDPEAARAPDEHIAAEVVRANARYLGAEPPLCSSVHRWPQAIPQTDLGHARRLAAVDALEAAMSGLVLAGNWRDGVSIADCVAGAERRAVQVQRMTQPAA